MKVKIYNVKPPAVKITHGQSTIEGRTTLQELKRVALKILKDLNKIKNKS